MRHIVLALAGLATFALAPTVPLAADAPQARMRILVRAFVPNTQNDKRSVTSPVPNRAGEWMMPGPTRSFPCFVSDNRGFSADPSAASQLVSDVTVTVYHDHADVRATKGAAAHAAGTVTQVNCQNGQVLSRRPVTLTAPHKISGVLSALPATAVVEGGTVRLSLGAAAMNPFVPAHVSPPVEYSIDLAYDTGTRTLSYKAVISRFPAYEAFVQLDDGRLTPLFQVTPTATSALRRFDMGTRMGPRTMRGKIKLAAD